jgi:hypothetical protein
MDESGSGPLGGKGVTLEADETFFGNKEGGRVDPWYFDNEGGWRKLRRLRIFGQRDKLKADRSKGA